MSEEGLELRAVTKSFGAHAVALHELTLALRPDRYTCIMGPSGSGKSTLLRILGGHEHPDAGRVWLGDRDVTAWPAERRPLHTVFQDHALFPFMSVLDNVAFAGRVAFRDLKGDVRERLGDGFDLDSFHGAVLAGGTIPPALVREELGERLGIA